jgi:hypothetical protein
MTAVKLQLGGAPGAVYDGAVLNDFVDWYNQLKGSFVSEGTATQLVNAAQHDTRAQALLWLWLDNDPGSFVPKAQDLILAFLEQQGLKDSKSPLSAVLAELDGQRRRQQVAQTLKEYSLCYASDVADRMVQQAGDDLAAQAILALGLERNQAAFLGNSAKTVRGYLERKGLNNPMSPLSMMVRKLEAANYNPVPGLRWADIADKKG